MTSLLDTGRLQEYVDDLNKDSTEWNLTSSNKLARKFKFSDFAVAWSFMSRVALFAERTNHHPEWRNVYNVVEVELTTHDAGGITGKDIALAEYMNEAASALA